jgi:hypothetical protein
LEPDGGICGRRACGCARWTRVCAKHPSRLSEVCGHVLFLDWKLLPLPLHPHPALTRRPLPSRERAEMCQNQKSSHGENVHQLTAFCWFAQNHRIGGPLPRRERADAQRPGEGDSP